MVTREALSFAVCDRCGTWQLPARVRECPRCGGPLMRPTIAPEKAAYPGAPEAK